MRPLFRGEKREPIEAAHWSCCGGLARGEARCAHRGEWRDTGAMLRHPATAGVPAQRISEACAFSSAFAEGGALCRHGAAVIAGPHWSCCGGRARDGGCTLWAAICAERNAQFLGHPPP